MKNFFEFNFFKYSWNTEKYLGYISFFYFLLTIYLYKELVGFISINLFWLVVLLIYLIFLVTWLLNRLNFTYFFKKIYVVFAVTIDQEDKKTLKAYDEIINLFKEKIKDHGFDGNVKVIKKHFDIRFNKHSAAEAKTKLNIVGHTIVISGMPITSLNETEFKFNFHYEFACPTNLQLKDLFKVEVNKKISKAIYGRDWCVRNSADSKKKLTGNLLSVLSYILALSMLTLKKNKEALDFLEPVIQQCNSEPLKFGPLISELRELLFLIYNMEFSDKIWNLKVEEIRESAEKMYKYDKYNYSALISMSLAQELAGDRDKAKQFNEKAESCHPKNVFSHELNNLYFCLTEKKFDEVETIINKLTQSIDLNINFPLHFLENKYKETGNPFLLFNSAVVRMVGEQYKCALNDIEEFKKILPNDKNGLFLLEIFYRIFTKGS